MTKNNLEGASSSAHAAAQDVFVLSAARTPVGAFQGALAELSAVTLGGIAIREALARAGVTPVGDGGSQAEGLGGDRIDEVYMGNVLSAGLGQAPARQAAIAAGLPHGTGATTVSKVCGSGLMSVVLGSRAIALGDAEVVVAGGMESMSGAPYLLPKARAGYRMGHGQLVDSMIHDGLWDPYHDMHMGQAGELCAKEYGFTRAMQDELAEQSYRRALDAVASGESAEEIVAVEIASRKQTVKVDRDEEPQRVKFDKMPSLRPAFAKDGTITAANASKLNDGAAAVVLASAAAAASTGRKPLARVLGYATYAHAPERFTTAPVGAIQKVLRKLNLEASDVDLWEINEAFAVVPMACMRDVGIDPARVNVRGGAIALGHPIGASGARVLVTLLHAMQARQAKRGLATLCIGGGEAVALVVEAL